MDFRRTDYGLFRELTGRILWEAAGEGRRVGWSSKMTHS